MKKLWLVLVALVVLAVGVGAYFMLAPDAQKIKLLLDTKAKPEIERALSEQFGEPVVLTYRDSESQGDGLMLYDLTLASKNDPDKKIVAQKALLSTLVYDTDGWGLSVDLNAISGGGGLSGDNFNIKKFRTDFGFKNITFEGVSARNLAMKMGNESMALQAADFSGLEIAGGDKVKFASGSIKGLEGNPDGEQFKLESANAEGFALDNMNQTVVLKHGAIKGLTGKFDGTDMKLESTEVEGLDVDNVKGKFALAKGSINGVDIKDSRSEGGLQKFYLEGAFFDEKENIVKLGKAEAEGMRFIEDGDGFSLKTLRVAEIPEVDLDEPQTWGFGATTLENMDVFNDNKKMASIDAIEAESLNSEEVLGQVLKVKNLFIDAQAMDPQERASLEMLGLKELRLSLVLDYQAKLKEEIAQLKELSINGDDLGDLMLKAQLSGIKIDLENPEASLDACSTTAIIDNVSFMYEDKGLVKKSLENQAKQANMSYEQFVEQQVKPMLAQAKQMNSPEIAQLAQAMEKFLNDPGTLKITINPPKPLKIMELMSMQDPAQQAKALGLVAEAD